MSTKAARIGITSLVLAVAFGALLYTSLGESAEYYKHVDEVLASPQEWQGKNLQVHGFAHDVRRKSDTLEYRFTVENNGKAMTAFYTGIAPDTFKDDAEVVLQGRLAQDGTFHVKENGLMAKCPSKYTPKEGVGNSTPADAGQAQTSGSN
jgi:cytochrome c-type biogenesis protein CcmE